MNYSGSQRRKVVLGALGVLVSRPAWTQGLIASKPVKIMVGFPAGQATDLVARLLAEKLQVASGKAHIVENKPGQGGSIALGELVRSRPDGNVSMLAHMTAVAVNPSLFKIFPTTPRRISSRWALWAICPSSSWSTPPCPSRRWQS